MINYKIVEDPELNFNERLRMELGWGDVAKGLNQVLMGYGVLFLGTVFGLGLIVLSMYSTLTEDVVRKSAKPSNASLWQLYLGMGILSVIGLISYGIIIGGQFKCLLHAAERHGARWFMFLCIACLFLGPAFHMASGIASWQAISELKKNPGRMQEFHLNPLGHWLQLIGFAISILYPLCFTLFLRATAVCLRSYGYAKVVDVFLVFGTAVVAVTGYLLWRHPRGAAPMPPLQALLLGGGWVLLGVFYVVVIAVIRICIQSVMTRVKSPLEM